MILSIVNKAVSNFFHFSAENNYLFGIHKIIALAELIGIATLEKSGLHPAAKFSQGDNSGVSNIDDIYILSTDIYNGNILENNATFIVKTYPASPAYMYQEAFSMYPIKRYWRAKVDGTWRGWIEL